MANKKISELTSATTPLAGTEVVPVVQGTATRRVTVQDIADLAGPGGSTTLDGLTDVTITGPAAGNVLQYDGAGWVNGTPGAGGLTAVNVDSRNLSGDGTSSKPVSAAGVTECGFTDPANDPAMPLWDYISPVDANYGTTTVAGGAVSMLTPTGSPYGYAWVSKQHFDPNHDASFEVEAKLEQVSGTSAWVSFVLIANAWDYAGLLMTRNVSTNLVDTLNVAGYYDEVSTNLYQQTDVAFDTYYKYRVVYRASESEAYLFFRDVLLGSVPWTPAGSFRVGIFTVAASGSQAKSTTRNIRATGRPVGTFFNLNNDSWHGTATGSLAGATDSTAGGDDYLTGAGTFTTRALTLPASSYGALTWRYSGTVTVQVLDGNGTLLPDTVVSGNSAGLSGGSKDLGGVSPLAYPTLKVKVTHAASGDKTQEVTLAYVPSGLGLRVKEADGSPAALLGTLVVPNGALSVSGDTGTLTFPVTYPDEGCSFTGNGDYYRPMTGACTLNIPGAVTRGTGTFTYAKALAASPTSFSTITTSTSFAAGDVLKITAASVTGYCAVAIPRTA